MYGKKLLRMVKCIKLRKSPKEAIEMKSINYVKKSECNIIDIVSAHPFIPSPLRDRDRGGCKAFKSHPSPSLSP
jgi:hypothetical protein